MKKITVTLADDRAAQAWLDLLKISDVVAISVETLPNGAEAPERKTRITRHVHRAARPLFRNLIERWPPGQRFWAKDANQLGIGLGFAENTAGATMSKMQIEGFADRDADGKWFFKQAIPDDWKFTT